MPRATMLFAAVASPAALAGQLVAPTSYDMLNGEIGAASFLDDTYSGAGDPTTPGAALSGGLGRLTDGVWTSSNWFDAPGVYVGWGAITPVITFHFASQIPFSAIQLQVDDSNGAGGVATPSVVRFDDGDTVIERQFLDFPSGIATFVSFNVQGLVGDTITMTILDGVEPWVLVSEARFIAIPSPGAAAVLLVASIPTLRRRR